MGLYIGNGIVVHPRAWLLFIIIIMVEIRGSKFEREHGPKEGIEEQLPAYFIVDSELNVSVAHYCENPLEVPEPEDFAKLFA